MFSLISYEICWFSLSIFLQTETTGAADSRIKAPVAPIEAEAADIKATGVNENVFELGCGEVSITA